jgi:hypothetical protein
MPRSVARPLQMVREAAGHIDAALLPSRAAGDCATTTAFLVELMGGSRV